MNKAERTAMVIAMDTIVRNLNDDTMIESWLMCGVADGDIDSSTTEVDDYYLEDKNFNDLMQLFGKIMKRALSDGIDCTFYCDRIANREVYDD